MKTSTKVWLVLFIISNVALFYFFSPMINTIKFNGTLYFEFTTEAYIGLGLFIIANVSGFFVIGRFIKSQPFSRQIFFSTILPSVTFFALMLFFSSITAVEQTDIVRAVRAGLGIQTKNAGYIWMAIVAGVYVLYLFAIYSLLSRPLKKIERAVDVLKDGKARKPLAIGGGQQFKNIETDLNMINENYKESEKIIRNISPLVIEDAIERTVKPSKAEMTPVVIPIKK